MATVTQYEISLLELTKTLLKQADIHEGRWLVGFSLGFAGGMVGPTTEDSWPSALVQIRGVTLVRQEEGTPVSPLMVDAAGENPKA
jgi:hypothetical protein